MPQIHQDCNRKEESTTH